MRTVSSGMGSGLIKHVELGDVLGEDWLEFLTLDIKMLPSSAFTSGSFKWQSPHGICNESMGLLN